MPLSLFVVARIGLERTAYTMSSTAETVEVCLYVSRPRISCPITFPFDIFFNLTTSAGHYNYNILVCIMGITAGANGGVLKSLKKLTFVASLP